MDTSKLNDLIERVESLEEAQKVTYIIKRNARAKGVEIDVAHECFEKLMLYCQFDVPIALVGPAGSGKSTICGQAAKALGLEFAYINLSIGVTESAIKGKNPHGDYIPSKFVEMYENGGVFLLDEFDAADPNVLMTLNGALAGELMDVPARWENPVAIRHKDFIPIVAMNTFGHGADRIYTGRNQLDGATLDRFLQIEMDYSYNIESTMGDIRCRELTWEIRKITTKNNFRKVVSSRMITKAHVMWQCYPLSDKMDIASELLLGWSKQERETILDTLRNQELPYEKAERVAAERAKREKEDEKRLKEQESWKLKEKTTDDFEIIEMSDEPEPIVDSESISWVALVHPPITPKFVVDIAQLRELRG